MSYVVINPHSNTNPSDLYLVAEFSEYMRILNGVQSGYKSPNEFTNYQDADNEKNRLNSQSPEFREVTNGSNASEKES